MAGKPLEPNSPLTVYNTQTMQPERLRSGEVETAILAGSHDFQAGETINIIGPDGKTGGGGVPAEELRKYLEAGYRLETPFEKVVNDYSDENDNVTGALKVGAQKAMSEFALGIPETIADYAQNPLDLAKRKKLYEDHQAAAVVGSLVGGGAGLVYGAPVFKAAEVAGKVVGRTLQKGIAETLIKSGVSAGVAKRVAVGMAGKIPAAAAQFAVEGAAVTAPRALTEAAFGDLDAAAESMLMGVGVGSVLGAAGSAVSPIAKGIGLSYRKFVKRPIARFGEEEAPVVGRALGETAEDAAAPRAPIKFPSDAPDGIVSDEEIYKRGQSYLRKNADDIDRISEELVGVKADPGMKTTNLAMQDARGKMVARGNTEESIKAGQYFTDLNNAAEQKVMTQFGLDDIRSRTVIAKESTESLQTTIREGFEPSVSKFRETDAALQGVELGDMEAKRVFDSVDSFARKEADRLRIPLKTGTLDDVLLEANITDIPNIDALSVSQRYQELKAFARDLRGKAGMGDKYAHRAAELYDNTAEHMLDQLDAFLGRSTKGLGPEAEALSAATLATFRQGRKEYAIQKANIKPIAKFFGISDKAGPETLQRLLEDVDPTKLGTKFANATAKEIESLRRIAPDIADAIINQQRAAFVNAAVVGSRDGISLARLTTAYKKSLESGKSHIFSEADHKVFKDIMTLQAALPNNLKNFNPSGSGRMNETNTALGKLAADIPFFGKMVAGLIDESSDNFTTKIAEKMTSTAAIPATQSLMRNSTKILRKVDAAVESALKGAAPRVERIRVRTGSVLERVLNQGDSASQKNAAQMTPQERMQEYVRRSESFASNIEASQEKLDDAFGGFYHYGAPETAGIAMNKATMAVNYLQSQMPPMSKPSSPYDKTTPRVSDSAIAAFERRLEVTEDPGIVAERLADGTLSKEHVETLRAVYPSIYGYMQQVTSERMAEVGMKKMSYQQRLKISLLMGLEVHPSMSGQTIATMQNTFAPKDPNQMPQGMGSGSSASSSESLASRTQTAGQKGQMA